MLCQKSLKIHLLRLIVGRFKIILQLFKIQKISFTSLHFLELKFRKPFQNFIIPLNIAVMIFIALFWKKNISDVIIFLEELQIQRLFNLIFVLVKDNSFDILNEF